MAFSPLEVALEAFPEAKLLIAADNAKRFTKVGFVFDLKHNGVMRL